MAVANKFRGWIVYDALIDSQSAVRHILSFSNVADVELKAVRDDHVVTGFDGDGELLVGMFADITLFKPAEMLLTMKHRMSSNLPIWFVPIEAQTDAKLLVVSYYKRRKAMRLHDKCEYIRRSDVYRSAREEVHGYTYQHWDGLHFTAPTLGRLEEQLLDAGIILY